MTDGTTSRRSTKILRLDEAERTVRGAQSRGDTVVLCHGCFDIVHPGHIRHLQQAAKLGDRLLVTITADSAVSKGEGRPHIPQEHRAENLAALGCVDWVAVNPHPTAVEILSRVRPDVYVKGREYEHNNDPRFRAERDLVDRYGGRVVFTSGDVVYSSSSLIATMEQAAGPFRETLQQLIRTHRSEFASAGRLIEQFRGRRIMVVGETILDTYVICDRPDIAGEAPVMSLRPIETRSFDGGAAIVARHIAAMGGEPVLLTALPADPSAEALRQRLFIEGVQTESITIDRPIIEKKRYLVGTTKVMKLDPGEPLTLDSADQKRLCEMARALAAPCDAVILADYGQGLFTSALLAELCRALRPIVDCLVGDVSGRRSNLLSMRNMDLICPSEAELRASLHDYDRGLNSVAWGVMERTGTKSALVTLGDEGLVAFDRKPDSNLFPHDWRSRLDAEHVPSLARHAVDELGCGDALLAAATLALTGGASLVLAAALGNIAAAAQVSRFGNAVVTAADLQVEVRRFNEVADTVRPSGASTEVNVFDDQLHLAHAQSQ